VVKKGARDEISDGEVTVECGERGASRRCGGQGDVLSGVAAAMLAWGVGGRPGDAGVPRAGGVPATVAAAYGACAVTRRAARWAFEGRKRSMVAGDVVEFVGPAVDALLDRGGAGSVAGNIGFQA